MARIQGWSSWEPPLSQMQGLVSPPPSGGEPEGHTLSQGEREGPRALRVANAAPLHGEADAPGCPGGRNSAQIGRGDGHARIPPLGHTVDGLNSLLHQATVCGKHQSRHWEGGRTTLPTVNNSVFKSTLEPEWTRERVQVSEVTWCQTGRRHCPSFPAGLFFGLLSAAPPTLLTRFPDIVGLFQNIPSGKRWQASWH